MRRLKAVKDLSVLIVAPRRHDRKLWADLLKNCGINHPTAMEDIKQAAHFIGSGQADVVFVDESYGAAGIANVLIPARGVEFSGGRGVCLILCSKKATAADVLNARRLGFASLVILPASTDTVRKHLELAARYIPPSDEELGWSAPAKREEKELPAMPEAREDVASQTNSGNASGSPLSASQPIAGAETQSQSVMPDLSAGASKEKDAAHTAEAQSKEERLDKAWAEEEANITGTDTGMNAGTGIYPANAPGRSGQSAEEEVIFL